MKYFGIVVGSPFFVWALYQFALSDDPRWLLTVITAPLGAWLFWEIGS